MTKISIVLGTRPEIIKLSPLIRLTKKSNSDVIFTGQHYDYEMGLQFMDELRLRNPDYKLKISEKNPAKQTGQIIQKLSDIFSKTQPDTVVVQGDTNTVLAGTVSALKSNIPVSHVEAGLRSFDWRMPEEHNRIATDHLSELLFSPTQLSKQNLIDEKVHGKIFVTGNTVIDAIKFNLKLAEKKSTIDVKEDFVLLTMHRAENVDNKKILGQITHTLINCREKIIFPVHPRTKNRLRRFGFFSKIQSAKNITMIEPVGYFDMLIMMKKCKFIITDSGGIQEEATSPEIRKKVLVIRDFTDRPEAVSVGMSELVGVTQTKILQAIKRSTKSKLSKKASPYGVGNSSRKILQIIQDYL